MKKADEYFLLAKSFFQNAENLTITTSESGNSFGKLNYNFPFLMRKLVANELLSDSIFFVEADNGSAIVADGFSYVQYTNGDKVKYEDDMAKEIKNQFFSFDAYVHASFADFDSYSLSVEYDSVTLTLSGLSKEAFIEKALNRGFMSTEEEFSAFCESITDYSYSTDIVFDNDGNVTEIVRRYSYKYENGKNILTMTKKI